MRASGFTLTRFREIAGRTKESSRAVEPMWRELFNSSVLDLAVPDTSLEYPPDDDKFTDDWLSRLSSQETNRKQAFFDEQLNFFFTVRIQNTSQTDPKRDVDVNRPPPELVALVSHLQVSVEATYISPDPASAPEVLHSARISTPPRTSSMPRSRAHDSLHPSIFPPSTPNPTPFTRDDDRRYTRSEGTVLVTEIWGQNTSDESSSEAFSLLWSEKEQRWVAVYRLGITVSFLRLNIHSPLLCLTVSATLREKAIPWTRPKHPLAPFMAKHGTAQDAEASSSPLKTDVGAPDHDEGSEELHGLEEVNLFEGLGAGPNFAITGPDRVYLPSTRLGGVTRRKFFSLPPVVRNVTSAPSPVAPTARLTNATLRKSFRKTLQTVSGFRVRMRTVFVPYVLLPSDERITDDEDDDEAERERREAGSDEHTVVLCVEIENSGESGRRVGFSVESVDVQIGGEGAKATLISWREGVSGSPNGAFPILISATEQYNLLYAVSFLRAPGDIDGFSLTSTPMGATSGDLQRAVTINIFGRPFLLSDKLSISDAHKLIAGQDIGEACNAGTVSLPTDIFSSRWNCVLDLSSNQHTHDLPELDDHDHDYATHMNALPEPASPFPMFSPRTTSPAGFNAFPPTPAPVAGHRRPTFPDTPFLKWSARSPTPTTSRPPPRTSFPLRGAPTKLGIQAPGGTAAAHSTTPTTYQPVFGIDPEDQQPPPAFDPYAKPPITPAYPAYPPLSAAPPTPASVGRAAANAGGSVVGPSVEIRRERVSILGVPRTPGPVVGGGERGAVGSVRYERGVEQGGVVVSVGLVFDGKGRGGGGIFPLDGFGVDVFVYNRSERRRVFEVGCPYRRRGGGKVGVGILPLDNRIRVGPLAPSTCQSVRMRFLALIPGVHTVDVVTLSDVESGYTVNLRSVLDVVVHERDGDGTSIVS